MTNEVSADIAKQNYFSGFVYNTSDLFDTVKSLFIFGSNIVESLSKSKGALNAIYAKNPVTNQAEIIDTYRSAPELGEMPFRERVLHAAANYMEKVFAGDCPQTMLIKLDPCGRADDLNTWNSVFLVEQLRLNDISVEAPMTFDEGAVVEMTGTFALITWNRILPLKFTPIAESTILAEILDVIYADVQSCGACGRYSDGCEAIYALARANSGSPGLSSQLVYRVADGGAVTNADIAALGGLSGSKIVAVGRYLMVISEALGGHVYAVKPTKAGITPAWTAVTSGYQAGGAPRAVYAKSPSEVFITGQGGYIYKSTNILTGVSVAHDASLTVQNGNAIDGAGQVVVSVHDGGRVLFSINNGDSYSLTDAFPNGAVNLRSVWVRNANQWEIGDADGKYWKTDDQGSSWSQVNLPNQSTLSEILDIKYSPDSSEVGAMAVQTNGNLGLVYRTITGGRSWYEDAPGIDNLPTNERINSVALCGVNAILAGGKKSGSTDGLLSEAKA